MSSNKKKLNIALIGAGGIGKVWAAAFKKTPEINLVCVADVDIGRAKDLAKGFPGANSRADWKEVVADRNIDAVVVATPHNLLAPISYTALSADKHVLCEKPAGINSKEIKSNVSLAGRKKRVYMAGFNHRYHSAFQMARKIFDSGEIGEATFARARYGFGGRPGYEKEWRFNKKISGGGELIDQGVHMIDLARWFLGDFKEVKGFAENYLWKNGVEDNGFALLRTKDKKVASIHVSWTNWKWIHSFEIYGSNGYLLIDGLDQRYVGPERLTIGKRDPEFKAPPEERVIIFDKEQKEDSFARELKEFYSAIRENRQPLSTGGDAYETMKIVEKIYADSKK